MINEQNPIIPQPTNAIEIDRAIYELNVLLDMNLNWLTHKYARAYRFIDKKTFRLYFPEVYIGNGQYHRVTPDNDKQGMCFFVVSKEEIKDFEMNTYNYLYYNVGIVFWVNLEAINKSLMDNEDFTQNLIRDVRRVLTYQGGRLPFNFKIKTIEREFEEIYREFNLEEKEDYLRIPHSGFRVNLELTLQEDCGNVFYDRITAIKNNLSDSEKAIVCSDFGTNGIAYNRVLQTGARISYYANDDYWNFINKPYPLNPIKPKYVQELDYTDQTRKTLLHDNEFGNKLRFTDRNGTQDFAGDGVAIDHLTGLMYSYQTFSFLWNDALDFAANSNYAGYTDWKMPNINEIRILWSAIYRFHLLAFITDLPSFSFNMGSSTTRYDRPEYFTYANYVFGSGNGLKASGNYRWVMVRNWK